MIYFLPSSTNTIHNDATFIRRGSIEEQGSPGGICKTIFTTSPLARFNESFSFFNHSPRYGSHSEVQWRIRRIRNGADHGGLGLWYHWLVLWHWNDLPSVSSRVFPCHLEQHTILQYFSFLQCFSPLGRIRTFSPPCKGGKSLPVRS